MIVRRGWFSDWEIVRNHKDAQGNEVQTAHLNTRYNFLTHDGATIYVQTTGTRTGAREVLEKLGEDTSIGPNNFKMRLHLTMETGDSRYSWVNDSVFVASSGRNGDQVIYDAYELLWALFEARSYWACKSPIDGRHSLLHSVIHQYRT